MRYTQKFFLLSCFASVLFLLTACGNQYALPKWDFNPPQKEAAQEKPKDLTEVDLEKSKATSVVAGVDDVHSLDAAAAPTVKVALLLPLTGSQASLGDAMLKAAQMALFDIGNLSFELMPYDTKATSDGARHAARQAVSDQAQLVLGPVFADSVRAAKDILRAENINMIAFSTDWSLTSSSVFTMGFLPFDQIERIVSYSAANRVKRVGIIAPSSTYGRAIVASYQALAEQYGQEIVDVYTYAPDTNNLAPGIREFAQYDARQMSAEQMALSKGISQDNDSRFKQEVERAKVKMKQPFDAILIAAGGENAIAISNLLTHFDLPPRAVRRLGTGLFDDPALGGEFALRDAWFAAPALESRRAFETRYESVYSEKPPRLASLAYDSTALASVLTQRGLQKGEGQPDFNRMAITNPNGFAGIDGIFRFLENGTVERGLAVLTFDQGGIVELDPAPTTFQLR